LSRPHGVNESSKQIVDNTCGAIFLGTPFEGSEKANWGSVALNFLSLLSSTKQEDVRDLEQRSQKLVSINEAFLKFLKERDRDRTKGPVEIACFFEEHPTYVRGKKLGLIVQKSSAGAIPGIDPVSISASHSGMCKFPGDYVNGYINISQLLARWITALEEEPNPSKDKVCPTYNHIFIPMLLIINTSILCIWEKRNIVALLTATKV
jgi:hypothetical protein